MAAVGVQRSSESSLDGQQRRSILMCWQRPITESPFTTTATTSTSTSTSSQQPADPSQSVSQSTSTSQSRAEQSRASSSNRGKKDTLLRGGREARDRTGVQPFREGRRRAGEGEGKGKRTRLSLSLSLSLTLTLLPCRLLSSLLSTSSSLPQWPSNQDCQVPSSQNYSPLFPNHGLLEQNVCYTLLHN